MIQPVRRTAPAVVATFLLPLFVPHAAAGDLLVLRDGTRITTRGAWQEKGRQVVFTSAAGELSALRTSEVDLDASRKATAMAAAPRPAATEPAASARPVILALDADQLGLGQDPDLALDAGPRSVVMYATSWCGVCRKTQALFDEIGLAYTYLDVDADPAARAERDRRSGGRQVVPVVDWGGEIIIGYDGSRFRALAKEDAEAEKARELAAKERERREAESARAAQDEGGLDDAAEAAGDLEAEPASDLADDSPDEADDDSGPPARSTA